MKRVIKFKLNGEEREELVLDNMTMVDFLRKQMHLTGTKEDVRKASAEHALYCWTALPSTPA